MDCFASLAMTDLSDPARQIDPTGNSFPICGNDVKPQNKKYFAFTEMRSVAYDRHPVPTRGALAIVTNAGRGAVDAEMPLTKGTEAYGKDVWS